MVERWRAREITTKSLAFRELPLLMKSRMFTESWQCSTILIGTRHPKPKRSSKRYQKPTLSCQTRRNEDSTTRWATRDLINATPDEDIFRGADFESIFRDMGFNFGFGDLFSTIFGQRELRRKSHKGQGSCLRHGNNLRRGSTRNRERNRVQKNRKVRRLRRHRSRSWQFAKNLPQLQGRRKDSKSEQE